MKNTMKILLTVVIVVIVILLSGIVSNVIRHYFIIFIIQKVYESSNELKISIKIIIMNKILSYQKSKLWRLHIRYIVMKINT